MTPVRITVDIDRVMSELDRLARMSDAPAPAVTRVVYTEADLAARALAKDLCLEAGLRVREDPIGNTFARWVGSRPDLAPLGTGSHIDAIPYSGRFDGTVGVIGALEAIRTLRRGGLQPVRSIELVIFTSEEPTRFGIGCLGSRALTASISIDALATLRDLEGRSLEQIRLDAGFQGELAKVRLPERYFVAFIELHIEQGPLLERANVPIGIVTAIAAPAALRITFEGEGGHAGAVLMSGRKDALCAAAQAILAVEASARASGSVDTVATTGICRVHPDAINAIPERVTLEVDIRDIDLVRRDVVLGSIRAGIEAISRERHVKARLECLTSDPPAFAAAEVVAEIDGVCRDLEIGSVPITSRAYHDSLFMARIAPTGMIFIPCRDRISHRPDEYSSPEAIACGIEVLALTLARLASREADSLDRADQPRSSVPVIVP
jgi:N-carbamoyl-L-amino-acid hydrolase